MPLLYQYLRDRAQSRPEATAIRMDGDAITYGALEDLSNRLARLLAEAGCLPGDRVAILMPKSLLAIACMHGVMKAAGIYVPIDSESPPARIARILLASDCRLILAGGHTASILEKLSADIRNCGEFVGLGWLDQAAAPESLPVVFRLADAATVSADDLAIPSRADEAAHILFTSGSTGLPKGVVVTHANVAAFVDWAVPHFGINTDDRCSGHSPFHFDLSTFDIYGSFAAGHPAGATDPMVLRPVSSILSGQVRRCRA